jgi:hypothetical protein
MLAVKRVFFVEVCSPLGDLLELLAMEKLVITPCANISISVLSDTQIHGVTNLSPNFTQYCHVLTFGEIFMFTVDVVSFVTQHIKLFFCMPTSTIRLHNSPFPPLTGLFV